METQGARREFVPEKSLLTFPSPCVPSWAFVVTLKEMGEQALQSQAALVLGQVSAEFLDKPWGP